MPRPSRAAGGARRPGRSITGGWGRCCIKVRVVTSLASAAARRLSLARTVLRAARHWHVEVRRKIATRSIT
eukprot:COSAG06_NODE_1075_length_10809_cov_5.838375_2_plen_71_part_00